MRWSRWDTIVSIWPAPCPGVHDVLPCCPAVKRLLLSSLPARSQGLGSQPQQQQQGGSVTRSIIVGLYRRRCTAMSAPEFHRGYGYHCMLV